MSAVGRPWSVQVELTEGCNRLCTFCGLNGIRSKPGEAYRYMTIATAERVVNELAELAPEARLEFAMHGEPMMNPDHVRILTMFALGLPRAQLQVTTNGIKLLGHMQQRLDALYDAGVHFVVLDTYQPERDKLRREAATLRGVRVWDFYDDMAPRGVSPYANHRPRWQRTLVLMDDLEARDGEVKSRVVMNHAGNSATKPPTKEPLAKTCTLPFRELAVCWDGSVNLCCMDWRAQYVPKPAGDTRTLTEVWHGAEFEAARAMLQNRDRAFGPCTVCDAGSGSRSGLLPKYPPVTPAQRAVVFTTQQRSGQHPHDRKRLQVLR